MDVVCYETSVTSASVVSPIWIEFLLKNILIIIIIIIIICSSRFRFQLVCVLYRLVIASLGKTIVTKITHLKKYMAEKEAKEEQEDI